MKSTILFPIILAFICIIAVVLSWFTIVSKEILWLFFWNNLLYLIGFAIAVSAVLSSSKTILIQNEIKYMLFILIIIFIGVFAWIQSILSDRIPTQDIIDSTTGAYFENARPSETVEFLLPISSKENKEEITPVYIWKNLENTLHIAKMNTNSKEQHIKINTLNSTDTSLYLQRKEDTNYGFFKKKFLNLFRISETFFSRHLYQNNYIAIILFYIMVISAYTSGFFIAYIDSSMLLRTAISLHWFLFVLLVFNLATNMDFIVLIFSSIFFLALDIILLLIMVKQYQLKRASHT